MDEPRAAHPYYMHDAILAQPGCIARVLRLQRERIERAAEDAAARKRILFAGIGTSYHAAKHGELFLRHFTAGRALAAAHNLETLCWGLFNATEFLFVE